MAGDGVCKPVASLKAFIRKLCKDFTIARFFAPLVAGFLVFNN